jgi:peptidoglycan L-alanyl-D-glutamate endopeptidase CwlK
MLKHEERLKGVDARLCAVVRKAAEKANFDITVAEGLRTKERQEKLVKEGKSKTMNSKHLVGKAVDLYPLGCDNMINWNGFTGLVRVMKEAAKELNVTIVCGADWGWDKPHFEIKN